MSTKELHWANVTWDGNHPCSTEYDDVYFSRNNGYREREDVFFFGNELEQRWADGNGYTVGELGFGTGLSFLITWSHWSRIRPPNQTFVFQSCDLSPLSPADLARACSAWPELQGWSEMLIAAYPPLEPGWHERDFPKEGVKLRLFWGDAKAALLGYLPTDAWYLDGFSPRKNSELWTAHIAHLVGLRSANHATVSTYSAASAVMRGYTEAGFQMERIPGFGGKRERLRGRLETDAAVPAACSGGRE